jgi:hypothetical protein
MWERRNKLLDELELEAEDRRKRLEEKVRALEEQVRQFRAAQVAQAAQTASGPEAVEAMRKILDDLRAEQRVGAQRIAAWASEASTTLVSLGVSPFQHWCGRRLSPTRSRYWILLLTAFDVWIRFSGPAWRLREVDFAGQQ